MKITVLTLFPKMIECFTAESMLGRAQKKGLLEIEAVNLADWGKGKWKKVDDTPYGGGAGMVLRVDVVAEAIKDIRSKHKAKGSDLRVILLTPQGQKYNQKIAQELSGDLANGKCDLLLVCGHYEGFDERIRDYVDLEISIGDYVLTGGELAAAVVIDSVARLLPGVLGKEESHQDDSFAITLSSKIKPQTYLEYPHYTRPEEFEGKKVPAVLKSGNHQKIEEWRREQSKSRTQKRRPDLLDE